MIAFLQPLFLAVLGIALFFYGVFHSVTGLPPAITFGVVLDAMPSVLTVLLFSLGVLAMFIGVYLLVAGVRGVRRRLREIRQAYGKRQPERYEDEDDRYGEPACR